MNDLILLLVQCKGYIEEKIEEGCADIDWQERLLSKLTNAIESITVLQLLVQEQQIKNMTSNGDHL